MGDSPSFREMALPGLVLQDALPIIVIEGKEYRLVPRDDTMQTQIDKLAARMEMLLEIRDGLTGLKERLDRIERAAPTPPGDGDHGADGPRIVCLCGSGRFREAFEQAEFDETLAGKIVLTIGCNTKDIARDVDWSHVKPMLDDLHLRKIDLADEVLILNVGGYIGESTARELAYTESLGKPVRYWESAPEPSPAPDEASDVRLPILSIHAYPDFLADVATAMHRSSDAHGVVQDIINSAVKHGFAAPADRAVVSEDLVLAVRDILDLLVEKRWVQIMKGGGMHRRLEAALRTERGESSPAPDEAANPNTAESIAWRSSRMTPKAIKDLTRMVGESWRGSVGYTSEERRFQAVATIVYDAALMQAQMALGLAAPADRAVAVTEDVHVAIGEAIHRHLDVADMDTDAYDRMIADIAEAALRAERGEGA